MSLKFVGSCKVSKKVAKKGFEYPIIRLPLELTDLIGKTVNIYQINDGSFLFVVADQLSNFVQPLNYINTANKNLPDYTSKANVAGSCNGWGLQGAVAPSCGGRDSNPRTPTGQDPQSCAFVRSATPAQKKDLAKDL